MAFLCIKKLQNLQSLFWESSGGHKLNNESSVRTGNGTQNERPYIKHIWLYLLKQ